MGLGSCAILDRSVLGTPNVEYRPGLHDPAYSTNVFIVRINVLLAD